MSADALLTATNRSKLGSAESRRLRWAGRIPANVYGHKQPVQSVTVGETELNSLIRGGVRVVDLDVDGKHDKAVIKDIQWDAMGSEIIHVDLFRVDPNERVNVDVPIELKGTAPGVLSGGVLEQPIHHVQIDVLAYEIPSVITVKIGALGLGQAIYVRDLPLPKSAHVHTPADAIIVHVVQVNTRALDAVASPAEPEVVGKKPGEAAAAEPAKDAKKK
jgi:large subunit ribosomal protein L25